MFNQVLAHSSFQQLCFLCFCQFAAHNITVVVVSVTISVNNCNKRQRTWHRASIAMSAIATPAAVFTI
ncbi:unnamed protein product [Lathyrus oleraceus]